MNNNVKNSENKQKSFVYFQLGLVVVLLFVYAVLEMKISDKNYSFKHDSRKEHEEVVFVMGQVIQPQKEEIRKVELKEIQSKQKSNSTFIDKVQLTKKEVDGKFNEEESSTKNEESSQDVSNSNNNSSINGVHTEIKEVKNLSIHVVEQLPVFPGCENVPKNEQLSCFEEQLHNHIKKQFRYPSEAKDKNLQGKITVTFLIDKYGAIEKIRLNGPKDAELLKKESERIIKLLPKLKPAQQGDYNVGVYYSVPIVFTLE